MSLFRAATTVTSPSGDYWELYVSKTALPAWRGSDADDIGPGVLGATDVGLLAIPLMLLSALWANLLLPLMRALVLLPVTVVRGRRSRAVRIEAVKAWPHREVARPARRDAQHPRRAANVCRLRPIAGARAAPRRRRQAPPSRGCLVDRAAHAGAARRDRRPPRCRNPGSDRVGTGPGTRSVRSAR